MTNLPHIPRAILEQLLEDSRILEENSNRIRTIIGDPELSRQIRENSIEYDALIRQCLQAIINLEDAVYPTRPRADLDKDGYEFRSGETGFVVAYDRF